MATVIVVNCPVHGDLEVEPADISVAVIREGDVAVGPRSSYSFRCESCAGRVVKPVNERAVRLLLTAGANVVHVYGEPNPERHADGPPLTLDDLIDLMLALDRVTADV